MLYQSNGHLHLDVMWSQIPQECVVKVHYQRFLITWVSLDGKALPVSDILLKIKVFNNYVKFQPTERPITKELFEYVIT